MVARGTENIPETATGRESGIETTIWIENVISETGNAIETTIGIENVISETEIETTIGIENAIPENETMTG